MNKELTMISKLAVMVLYFFVKPVLPTYRRCRGWLLHLITLNYTNTHPLGIPWKRYQPIAMAYDVLFQHIPGENEENHGTTLTTGCFSTSLTGTTSENKLLVSCLLSSLLT